AGGETVDVHLDRLGNLDRTGIDDLLAEILRAAFPLPILGMVHAGLREQLVHQLAIGAFERANEGPLLGPPFPDRLLGRRGGVVAGSGNFTALQFAQSITIRQWCSPGLPMNSAPCMSPDRGTGRRANKSRPISVAAMSREGSLRQMAAKRHAFSRCSRNLR